MLRIARSLTLLAAAFTAGCGSGADSGPPQPSPSSCGAPVKATVMHTTGWAAHWSHAAKTIAYNDLGSDGYYHIHLMNEDGSGDRVFGPGIAGFPTRTVGSPYWDPTGKYLAFVAEKPTHPGSSSEATPGWGSWSDVWIAAVDGSGVWPLTNVPTDPDHGTLIPIFSQDGRQILWTERTLRSNPFSLKQFAAYWVLRLADIRIDQDGPHLSNIRTIQPGGVDSFTESGGFSLDGRSLLLTSNYETNNFWSSQIYRYDIASGTLTRLTELNTYNEHPRFTPDGKIIWMTDKNHTLAGADWWVMNADGTAKTQLSFFNVTGHAESDGSPRWVGPIPIENWSNDRSFFLGDVEYDLLKPSYTFDKVELSCGR
jgi:Tol biopolymer transport system component